MRTEAWWVCICKTPIYKVGKGNKKKWSEHIKICINPNPGLGIKQLKQTTRK